MPKHLWEVDHPYYMNEGNFFKAGEHQTHKNLDDFLHSWSEVDIDLNRVHRFDWIEHESPKAAGDGTLSIFFILQRKARLMSCEVEVTAADEPRVIDFLRPHYEREVAIWQPFGPEPKPKSNKRPLKRS